VGFLCDSLSRHGGAERSVVLLAEGLAGRGHAVSIYVRPLADEDVARMSPAVRVKRLPASTASSHRLVRVPALIWRLIRQVRVDRIDVLVAFKPQNAIPAVVVGVVLGVPVVASERTSVRARNHYWHWRVARHVVYRRATALVVQTHRAAIEAQRFASERRIHVVPNMVEVPAEPSITASAWRLWPGGRPEGRLVTVGRLNRAEKAQDRLVDAFARVSQSVPQWSLLILGEGDFRRELEAQIRGLRLSDRVTLGGFVDDPFPTLFDSDAFAYTSRFDGFPNALLEAMAVGLPVISYDCPYGPAELIDNGKNGLLVPDGDQLAFEEGLLRLMIDETLRKKLGSAARASCEKYSPRSVLSSWERLLGAIDPVATEQQGR
jgi:glycosyltransferase involved in cell wall biosynthesis